MAILYSLIVITTCCKFLIDKIDRFLMICQNFPYQIFPLAITLVAPVTVFSIFNHQIFLSGNSTMFSLINNLHYTVVVTSMICCLLLQG